MSTFHISKDGQGMGGFLNPPGDPEHFYLVRESGRNGSLMSLRSAVAEDYVPASVRERAAKLLAEATPTCSELWVREVYGYFKNCYSPDGVNRDTGDCLIDGTGNLPAEHHLAVMFVRTFFPDHEPRTDLIANPAGLYGSRSCRKCGEAVQYEPRIDGYVRYGRAGGDICEADGGRHEREEVQA